MSDTNVGNVAAAALIDGWISSHFPFNYLTVKRNASPTDLQRQVYLTTNAKGNASWQ
jgi:hypothetical protein